MKQQPLPSRCSLSNTFYILSKYTITASGMKVLKFGGTSVGKPERMRRVSDIIVSDPSPKIVVLSALAGTTNALVDIGAGLAAKRLDNVRRQWKELRQHYLEYCGALFGTQKFLMLAHDLVELHFEWIATLFQGEFTDQIGKSLLAQGELISTKLLSMFLEEMGHTNTLLPALEFMAIDSNDEPDMNFIGVHLKEMLAQNPSGGPFITQGYICLNAAQQIDNLKRGGSDYTASLIGAAICADVVEIWTDIDGMHNNDPRIVENTRPVANLSFDEASELAYFGAKILHPSSILPAKQHNITVHLKNTMNPHAAGTVIKKEEQPRLVKAIAAKDGITAIKIKSTRMLLAYGFLSRVFKVFEQYRTPIDMITTSEVAVSLTIDDKANLPKIADELKVFGEVVIDEKQSIICLVGNEIVMQKGIVRKIFDALHEIPIRMISYGGSKYNISVLIDSKYKKEALLALNSKLFDL
jgi:aspartate kinase